MRTNDFTILSIWIILNISLHKHFLKLNIWLTGFYKTQEVASRTILFEYFLLEMLLAFGVWFTLVCSNDIDEVMLVCF